MEKIINYFKTRVKNILQRSSLFQYIIEKGYCSKTIRRQRIVNFIFQRILRINSDCKYSVHFTSKVLKPEKIIVGKGVDKSFMLSGNCYFQGNNGIRIGDNTIIGPGVKIISANHGIDVRDKYLKIRPIIIGKNCWIGANVIILPGTVIGDNTIVGAGTIIKRSFPKGNVIIITNRDLEVESRCIYREK